MKYHKNYVIPYFDHRNFVVKNKPVRTEIWVATILPPITAIPVQTPWPIIPPVITP